VLPSVLRQAELEGLEELERQTIVAAEAEAEAEAEVEVEGIAEVRPWHILHASKCALCVKVALA
jgi:hypothetical protein